MNPLEAMVLSLNKELRASGRTVTEETEPLDGPEYRVVFPANRESEQSPSESPSNMSQDSNSAQDDSMVPAMDSYEQALQARVAPQETEQDGIRAEAQRRLKVRQQYPVHPAPTKD